jgi:hypothetical protein
MSALTSSCRLQRPALRPPCRRFSAMSRPTPRGVSHTPEFSYGWGGVKRRRSCHHNATHSWHRAGALLVAQHPLTASSVVDVPPIGASSGSRTRPYPALVALSVHTLARVMGRVSRCPRSSGGAFAHEFTYQDGSSLGTGTLLSVLGAFALGWAMRGRIHAA